MTDVLVHTNTFAAPVGRVYAAITNDAEHSAFTGAPATGMGHVGASFTTHGGAIEGTTLAAKENSYLVQAWRPADWPEGVYSLVRYDFGDDRNSTTLTLTHSSMPDGASEHLAAGWNERYWAPLAIYLGDHSA